MKKIVIAAAIIAAGAGGYWYTQNGAGSSASANPLLDYVPADTPLFSGQLTPFPLKPIYSLFLEIISNTPVML